MDRVLSMEAIAAGHFWISPPPHQFDVNSIIAPSSSSLEWDSQLFIQENIAAASDHSPAAAAPKVDDEQVVEIRGSRAASAPPIDSDEYWAFLRSRLDLACAAVAITRASMPQDSSTSTDSMSKVLTAMQADSKENQKGSGSYSCKRKAKDMPPRNPSLPAKRNKPVVQLKSSTRSSSGELSHDYELEGSTERNMDHTDDKRMRRKMSNRESARRSRNRKQAHLADLETQVAQLRFENLFLLKRLTDISQKFDEAVVVNRVLKADVETLKTKLNMAEETVKSVKVQVQMFQTMSETSTFNMQSYDGRASGTSTGDIYPQHILNPSKNSKDPGASSSFSNNSSVVNHQQGRLSEEPISSSVSSVEQMPPMQRLASLEHLQNGM